MDTAKRIGAMRTTTTSTATNYEAQPKLLGVLRCDQIQGYLVSKPLAIDDMMAFLSRTRKQARK